LPIAAYCSHSQANGDQEDFEETYAARPDCFQDTFYNNILTSKNFSKPLGDPPPLPCVQYIDPEVPLYACELCSQSIVIDGLQKNHWRSKCLEVYTKARQLTV
jgi:hypothetical protein